MNIVRVEDVSLVDWPGQISSVFFVVGCNMNCSFCFNKDLISFNTDNWVVYSLEEAVKLVPDKIDHIVISGGEAFAQYDIVESIHKLKKMGYKVAVHTNGSYPEIYKTIYSLDYIAMDIKGIISKYYERRFSSKIDMHNVMDSLYAITDSVTPHEFRTTMFPGIEESEIYAIANLLRDLNADAYYLQPYIPVNGEKPKEYMSRDQINSIARKISKEFKSKGCGIKIIARG